MSEGKEKDPELPPQPLDYRAARDDARPGTFGEFTSGLIVAILFIGMMVYQVAFAWRPPTTQPVAKPPKVILVVASLAIAAGFGISAYYLLRRRRWGMFLAGFACGLCIVCLLSGFCFATR
jgi:hypothetical protein